MGTARVKWPNDVWIEGRKLMGCLVDRGDTDHVIVGIGINVNQSLNGTVVCLYPSLSSIRCNVGVMIEEYDYLLTRLFPDAVTLSQGRVI